MMIFIINIRKIFLRMFSIQILHWNAQKHICLGAKMETKKNLTSDFLFNYEKILYILIYLSPSLYSSK